MNTQLGCFVPTVGHRLPRKHRTRAAVHTRMVEHRSIKDAAAAVRAASRVVVFTGAGASADSGIDTFRSPSTGLWTGLLGKFALFWFGTPIGWNLTPRWAWSAFVKDFYLPIAMAAPNQGHEAVVQLGSHIPGQLSIVTMNVDGLHQQAGSAIVHEVHGTVRSFRCIAEGHKMDLRAENLHSGSPAPRCVRCDSYARPDCVLFTEGLPEDKWKDAVQAVDLLEPKDVFLAVGTSSLVQPAASLPRRARSRGAVIIEVNVEAVTPLVENHITDILLVGKAAEILPVLVGSL